MRGFDFADSTYLGALALMMMINNIIMTVYIIVNADENHRELIEVLERQK